MSDRLKLSDLKGDKSVDETARKLIVEDLRAQAKALERRNAELERMLAEQTKKMQPASKSAKVGARKDSTFKAVSTAPSINKTPRGPAMVPVAYPTVQDLSNSVGTAKTVRFNGKPVYLLDSSSQPSCRGDHAGTGGGVRSGTVNGEVKPVGGSKSVRVEGKGVVREGDACTMNGGNNPGVYVTVPPQSSEPPKYAIETSNPAWVVKRPIEFDALQQWLDITTIEVVEAVKHPADGVVGMAKGMTNAASAFLELLSQGAARKKALDLEESALLQAYAGNSSAATNRLEVAQKLVEGSAHIDLPELPLNNAAQRGGDKISVVLQVFSSVGGAVTSGLRFVGLSNAPRATTGIASIADGVRVIGNVESRVLAYRPTSGVLLQAEKGKTTTILGSYNKDMRHVLAETGNVKSLDFGAKIDDFNVLNVPDELYLSPQQFWKSYNDPWLANAIVRNDKFLLATEPAFAILDADTGLSSLIKLNKGTGKYELTGFGKEYLKLRKAGYSYNNGTMRK